MSLIRWAVSCNSGVWMDRSKVALGSVYLSLSITTVQKSSIQ